MALKFPRVVARVIAPIVRHLPHLDAKPAPESVAIDHLDSAVAAPLPPRAELFPFAKGKGGGLTPPVDFSRFLDTTNPLYADPTEADIVEKLKPVLLEYVNTARFGEFRGERDIPIRYAVFDPPPGVPVKGVINLFVGRGESFVKHAETLYNLRDLRAQGWVIATMDHRGQGFSGRELGDREKDHVRDFDDFVRDERSFTQLVDRHFQTGGKPHQLIAHSMGGAIATRYLEQHPGEYQNAVLLSPMLDVRTGFANPVEDVIADVAGTFASERYAKGQHPYARSRFETNHSTHCRARFEVREQLAELFPEIAIGGPTWGWLKQAVIATRSIMQPAALDKLKGVGVHLLCSSDDALVEPEAQDALAKHLGIEVKKYPDTRHELLNHGDGVRGQVMADVRAALVT